MESALRGTPDHVVLPLSGRILDHSHIDMAAKIIEVIYRYQNKRAGSEGIESDIGLLSGLAQAYSHVKANQPIKMCLPAFPSNLPTRRSRSLGASPTRPRNLLWPILTDFARLSRTYTVLERNLLSFLMVSYTTVSIYSARLATALANIM